MIKIIMTLILACTSLFCQESYNISDGLSEDDVQSIVDKIVHEIRDVSDKNYGKKSYVITVEQIKRPSSQEVILLKKINEAITNGKYDPVSANKLMISTHIKTQVDKNVVFYFVDAQLTDVNSGKIVYINDIQLRKVVN